MRAKPTILLALIAIASGSTGTGADAETLGFSTSNGTPTVMWAIPFGETDAAADEIDGISVDPSGNTVVSGIFRDGLQVGNQQFSSRGQGDIFLASYAASGGLNWVQQIGASGDDNTFDLKTDGSGNIYASGWFSNTITFGDVTLTSQGSTDMFLAKIDANGRTLWARSFGGRGGDGGNEISVLSGGDIAVAAISGGDFQVDGQSYASGGGERDAYVMRLNSRGEVLWVYPFNGPGTERIRAISMNEQGEVFVGFQYRGAVSMGGTSLRARGGWDGAAAKLSANGDPVWLLPVGGSGTDNVRGIGAAPDGSVYISGVFEGPAILIDQEVPEVGRKGDDFLIRLAGSGKPQWIVSLSGKGTNTGGELQADSRGVIISAVVDGAVTLRLNRDKITTFEPPSGRPTSYVAAFSAQGNPRFIYMPEPQGKGSAALGDVLSISRDGRYLAQALRFRGTLQAGDREMSTPSEKDSVIVLLKLNGS